MELNMTKGNRVEMVTKEGEGLKKVHIGLGWDVKGGAGSYDLDVFAIQLNSDKKVIDSDLNKSTLYFNNKNLPGLIHSGDNLTGKGDGDDEAIKIDFSAIPENVKEIMIGVNIYQAQSKGGQNFGNVDNAFVRYADDANVNETLKRYDLTNEYSGFSAIMVARLYRSENGWMFQALGEGLNGEIDQLVAVYA